MVATLTTWKPSTRWKRAVRNETQRFTRLARGHRLRSRVEFAEQVIVIPEGPHEGEHWRRHFQPFSYWVLHLMDTLGFRKYRGTGCVQSGKTFTLDVIPALWHLRERRENVIFGLPEMDMAETKWILEFVPVFEASPDLRWLLPTHGRGSRGGFATLIKLRNGATLKFMGGSGKDSRRSGATAPVVIKTEVDRYDQPSQASRETTAVEQMESRTAAFDDRMFSYEECTVTTEQGRIWSEFNAGTGTEFFVRCTSCRQPVLPGRDDLHGVEDATDVLQAGVIGQFACPACGVVWEERDRQEMLRCDRIIPVHRGQTARIGDDGEIVVEGAMPPTRSLSFRWNAFHNRFWKTSRIAEEEWNALYSQQPTEFDLKRRQFAWALPAEPKEYDLVPLTLGEVYNRFSDWGLGVVPPNTRFVTRGVDVSKRKLHYVVRAWSTEDGKTWFGRAVEIGSIDVAWESLGLREALIAALTELRTEKAVYRDADGRAFPVHLSLVDGGWMEEVIWSFMLDLKERRIKGWLLVLGRGQSEPPGKGAYSEPQRVDVARGPCLWKGEHCYIRQSDKYRAPFVIANSDEWKSFIHDGLASPLDKNGALSHFKAVTAEEKQIVREYYKQVLSEKRQRRKVPRRGIVDVWVHDNNVPNHEFDADYYACVAGNILGVRVVTREREQPPAATQEASEPLTMPDGRRYLDVGGI